MTRETKHCPHCGQLFTTQDMGSLMDEEEARKSAATGLIKAVEYLLTIIDRNAPKLNGMMEVDYARAAIAKAKGEANG